MSAENPHKEMYISSPHTFGIGIGFHGQGARTYKEEKAINLLPDPYGSNPFRFSHLNRIVNTEEDWRMVGDPNNPWGIFERVMLDGIEPNAKRLHGN